MSHKPGMDSQLHPPEGDPAVSAVTETTSGDRGPAVSQSLPPGRDPALNPELTDASATGDRGPAVSEELEQVMKSIVFIEEATTGESIISDLTLFMNSIRELRASSASEILLQNGYQHLLIESGILLQKGYRRLLIEFSILLKKLLVSYPTYCGSLAAVVSPAINAPCSSESKVAASAPPTSEHNVELMRAFGRRYKDVEVVFPGDLAVLREMFEFLVLAQEHDKALAAFEAQRVEEMNNWISQVTNMISSLEKEEGQAINYWISNASMFGHNIVTQEKNIREIVTGDKSLGTYIIQAAKTFLGLGDSLVSALREDGKLVLILAMREVLTDPTAEWYKETIIRKEASDTISNLEEHFITAYVFFETRLFDRKDPWISSQEDWKIYHETKFIVTILKMITQSKDGLRHKFVLPLFCADESVHMGKFEEQSDSLEEHMMYMLCGCYENLKTAARKFENKALGCLYLLNNLSYVLEHLPQIEVMPNLFRKMIINQINEEENLFVRYLCADLMPIITTLNLPPDPKASQKQLLKSLHAFNELLAEKLEMMKTWVLTNKDSTLNIRTHAWQLLGEQYRRFLAEIDRVTGRGKGKVREHDIEKTIRWTHPQLEVVINGLLNDDT